MVSDSLCKYNTPYYIIVGRILKKCILEYFTGKYEHLVSFSM